MDTVIMPLGSSICQSTPADFDLMGGPGDGAIARVVCLRGRIGVTALGQLAPTMNDVGISAICYGELGALLTTCTLVIVLYRSIPAFSLVIVSS